MNYSFSFAVAVLAPAVVLGTASCSSMGQTRARMAEWKEKREEQQLARQVALAEKELEEEGERGGGAPTGMEESIFLDYANPNGSLLEGVATGGEFAAGYGGGPALPGSELPVLVDWDATDGATTSGDGPIFLGDGESAGGLPVVDADLVRAWASSISPMMGASLTEPLITAAMTARMTPTESAVAAHAAATDLAPLANAFAGQPAPPHGRRQTSELEHE